MNICNKLCGECPFSKKSIKGFIANYSIDDFQQMMGHEISFPCHMSMDDEGVDVDDVLGIIEKGEMKLCRGYIESIIKSAKMPYHNKQIVEAVKLVKEQGLSEDSMSIWEFRKHHTLGE